MKYNNIVYGFSCGLALALAISIQLDIERFLVRALLGWSLCGFGVILAGIKKDKK